MTTKLLIILLMTIIIQMAHSNEIINAEKIDDVIINWGFQKITWKGQQGFFLPLNGMTKLKKTVNELVKLRSWQSNYWTKFDKMIKVETQRNIFRNAFIMDVIFNILLVGACVLVGYTAYQRGYIDSFYEQK